MALIDIIREESKRMPERPTDWRDADDWLMERPGEGNAVLLRVLATALAWGVPEAEITDLLNDCDDATLFSDVLERAGALAWSVLDC